MQFKKLIRSYTPVIFDKKLLAQMLLVVCAGITLISSSAVGNDRLKKIPSPPKFSEARAQGLGIRVLKGKHITLYTDMESRPEIDELPAVFDAAVPQWAEYFGIKPSSVRSWHMQGYLMKDREPFRAIEMFPKAREGVKNGYSTGFELWLQDQPSDYYRRHLLLHEGTHGFMNTMLGSSGPGWYMEGMAELLGTHTWNGKQLKLGVMPDSREAFPMLGRIKLIQKAVRKKQGRRIPTIMATDNLNVLEDETYAWCWAVCKFFDAHPKYQSRFRKMHKHVLRPNFNDMFIKTFKNDWPSILHEWQLFSGTLAYHHALPKTVLQLKPGKLLADSQNVSIAVQSDRGWQTSDILLEAGKTYHIKAAGRYQVGEDIGSTPMSEPKPWWCEPNGISLSYYRSRRLGQLLGTLYVAPIKKNRAAMSAAEKSAARKEIPRLENGTPFLFPFAIGIETEYTPKRNGTLYLKINDSPGSLHDNAGELTVTVQQK